MQIPYMEYWLPLAIGVGVGLLAVIVFRTLAPRASSYVPKEDDARARLGTDYDPFEKGSRSENRKSFRRGGNPIRVHYCTPDKKAVPNEGWVIDRSMGGICVGVPEPVPQGTVLSLLPLNAPPLTPWIDVEVRSCRDVDGQSELGCQFVKVPPWSILLLFG